MADPNNKAKSDGPKSSSPNRRDQADELQNPSQAVRPASPYRHASEPNGRDTPQPWSSVTRATFDKICALTHGEFQALCETLGAPTPLLSVRIGLSTNAGSRRGQALTLLQWCRNNGFSEKDLSRVVSSRLLSAVRRAIVTGGSKLGAWGIAIFLVGSMLNAWIPGIFGMVGLSILGWASGMISALIVILFVFLAGWTIGEQQGVKSTKPKLDKDAEAGYVLLYSMPAGDDNTQVEGRLLGELSQRVRLEAYAGRHGELRVVLNQIEDYIRLGKQLETDHAVLRLARAQLQMALDEIADTAARDETVFGETLKFVPWLFGVLAATITALKHYNYLYGVVPAAIALWGYCVVRRTNATRATPLMTRIEAAITAVAGAASRVRLDLMSSDQSTPDVGISNGAGTTGVRAVDDRGEEDVVGSPDRPRASMERSRK
jgi:hypothetical protein